MSDTQDYKTVTFDTGELLAVAFALDMRIIELSNSARFCTDKDMFEKLIVAASSARAKVEAVL